jgi:hypothetical protein
MAADMKKQDVGVDQHKIDIYALLLKEINEALLAAQQQSRISFLNAVDAAVDKVVASRNLLQKDVREVADYVLRDMSATAEDLTRTGKSLAEWWQEDVALAESYIARWIQLIADKTTLEWSELQQQLAAKPQREYRTGEVAMLANLRCVDCKKISRISHIQVIAPCEDCEGTRFKRVK